MNDLQSKISELSKKLLYKKLTIKPDTQLSIGIGDNIVCTSVCEPRNDLVLHIFKNDIWYIVNFNNFNDILYCIENDIIEINDGGYEIYKDYKYRREKNPEHKLQVIELNYINPTNAIRIFQINELQELFHQYELHFQPNEYNIPPKVLCTALFQQNDDEFIIAFYAQDYFCSFIFSTLEELNKFLMRLNPEIGDYHGTEINALLDSKFKK